MWPFKNTNKQIKNMRYLMCDPFGVGNGMEPTWAIKLGPLWGRAYWK
jgi:hypothetical protein